MDIITDIKNAFLPELIILISIVLNIIFALFINKNTYKKAKIVNISAIIIAFISMAFIQITPNCYAFHNAFVSNIYTLAFKIMILISALMVISASYNIIREKRKKCFEFFAVIQSAILSSFSLISSNDFLTAFVSLEMLSLSCYLLTGFRKNHKSKEAALKYLMTSACASSIFLLGVSYLYGISGNINLSIINDIYINEPAGLMFIAACIFIIAGIIFKLGCIPFSNWLIDVYEGANYSIGAFLSLIPKISATAFISRLFVFIFQFTPVLQVITAFLALITIIYASIGALKQTNIKRFYGYSSIIHSGFILLTVSIANVYALSGVLFYLFTYIFMNMGVWGTSIIFNNEYNTDDMNDYKGLYYKHPYFASAFIVCLAALAGLPPTSGFLAKLYIFTAISRADTIYIIILLAAMFSTVISMFVYFKIIRILFEKQTNNISFNHKFNIQKIVLYFCAVITVLICINPDLPVKLSQITAYYL